MSDAATVAIVVKDAGIEVRLLPEQSAEECEACVACERGLWGGDEGW